MAKIRHILIGLFILALAACGQTPGPTPNPGPTPEPGGGSLPAELVGDWFTGTISSIQFYDPITGQWAAPNGEGFYFIFRGDGSYEEGAVINSTQYNCTVQLLGRAVGRAEVSGNTMTLHQQSRKVHVTNTCSGVGDNEEGARETVYTYEFKNDANGNYGLFLTQSDGTPYGTFYPWGQKPNPTPHPNPGPNPNPNPNPNPDDLTLSGTVYAPAGGDVAGTIVYACYLQGDACDTAKSASDGVPEHGASATFRVEGLAAVPYMLVAFQDVDGDGDFFGEGDYYAELPGALTPPQTGLELRLEVIGGVDPEPELDLLGTVYAPFGGDVSGTIVFACAVDGDGCDEARSRTFSVTGAGASADFSFTGLEPIAYYLFAIADKDGNGALGAGDYLADYGEVTPPAVGLELHLSEVE